ncbi:MAG: FAD-binding oxidoreductase, partial [Ktedonobacterales bacterium]
MLSQRIVAELREIVGDQGIVAEPEQLRTYESDGLASYRVTPALVVLPTTTAQTQAVVRVCHREGIPFVPRGSGTGLSGGALPVEGCVVIG